MRPLLLTTAVVLAVAACGGSPSDTARPTTPPPAPTTTAAALPEPPTQAQVDAFLDRVRSVDAGLLHDPVEAARLGQAICADIAQGRPEETVVGNTAARFSVDRDLAGHLVDAARATICR